MVTARTEHIEPGFAAHVAIPAAGSGPGLVLLQEIFGVNEYIKDAARRLAEAGYVVLAPDLYWRVQPGLALSSGDLRGGMAASQRLDGDLAVRDATSALAVLRGLPEVAGPAGVFGFCLGGTIAWKVAAQADPDAAVCYYGSGIAGALDAVSDIACPVLLHFGGADEFIGREGIDAVAAMAAGRDTIECHVHKGAGHAFDNSFSPRFSQPEPAARAWELTGAFLARSLPVA